MSSTFARELMADQKGVSDFILKSLVVIAGSVALAGSSKISVPFYPVPLTLQTFVLLTLSMALGSRMALAMVGVYLLQGALGLPVFAGTPERGIGFTYMMGPTGGYLAGFAAAAGLVGWLAERGWDRHILWTAVAMFWGNCLIYIPGLLWLGASLGWDQPILAWGLVPFLWGDLLKLILAALCLPLAWRFWNRLH